MVACAVKLSPPIALSYFTRAFRTSTGVPALAAVAARLAKVRDLLRNPSLRWGSRAL